MTSALFGILQLDRGDPLGYATVAGLVQSWLHHAGLFAMAGLVLYLLFALSRPANKSQSEKIRVPVSLFMVSCAALAIIFYAIAAALYGMVISQRYFVAGMMLLAPPPPPPAPGMPFVPPPPTFETELIPLAMMFAGLFALLGIGEPFARDLAKIFRRNLSLSFSGVRRIAHSVRASAADLLTARRATVLGIAVAAYAALGIAVYALGSERLFGIYLGVLVVVVTVIVLALLVLMLFEAEGPVWAIAKLSFKEALRSQLLWVFLLVFLPSLFPAGWFRQIKPGDELRVSVERMDLAMTLLVLFPALLLASFYGIPNDIKNLNIYTIVSKPVVTFEIVLGRFVGYVALMTLVLIGLTGVGLVLITNTSISDKAREQTYKARVPVRGSLEFKSVQAQFRDEKKDFEGTNVGREFDYRKYIAGHESSPQRAIWHFASLPSGLGSTEGDRVPVEFTFDVFKLTKGEQNKGVSVSFRFVTHNALQEQPTGAGEWPWKDRDQQAKYEARVKELQARGLNPAGARPGSPAWVEVNKLAEEFGCYEIRGKEVFDYQVMGVEIPAGLFRNAAKGDPGKVKDPKTEKDVPAPRLSVYVKCETGGQLLGVAQPDLYLLEYEQPFALNYLKGMIGLWCWLCILVGLAVTFSTYFSGVLSLLIAGTIFVGGFAYAHLQDVAANRVVGGGPFESISKLMKAEQPTTPTPETAGNKALARLDSVWSWSLRRVQSMIPDLESMNWSPFVAEGFNISTEYLLVSLLVTFGYLLPWAILAFYLMKFREVAA